MANDYFNHVGEDDRLAPGTKARADAVNALLDKIETGLDKLPTQNQLNRGTRNYAANDGGSPNAYSSAAGFSHISGSYQTGQNVTLLIASGDTNTSTTCTLNISGIGAASIKYPDGSDPAVGDLVGMCDFRYTGAVWHLTSIGIASHRVAATARDAAEAAQSYAAEWAVAVGLVSAAAGGNEVDEYSAAYYASAASGSASAASGSASAASGSASAASGSADAAAASAAELQSQSSLSYNATTAFDFDGNQTQVMATVTGNLTTLTTSNRAAGKSFSVLLIASGGDRAITYNASWRLLGYVPTTIPSGKALLMTFVCTGSAETDVFVAGVLEA